LVKAAQQPNLADPLRCARARLTLSVSVIQDEYIID
jgi:hypothetical protein